MQPTATNTDLDLRRVTFNKADRTWTAAYGDLVVKDGCARPSEAEQALDDYVFQHLRRHHTLPVTETHVSEADAPETQGEDTPDAPLDPLTLFAPVGPFPGWPIADGTLERAYALLLAEYGDRPKVMERAARALDLARDADAWSVPEPGVLCVRGSRPNQDYLVRDLPVEGGSDTMRDCTQQQLDASDQTVLKEQPCPDHTSRTHVHGGLCKHLICRELIRLAQHLSAAQATTEEASVTLTGQAFGLAFGIARLADNAAITIQIHDDTLKIAAGDAHTVQLRCDDGSGHGALALEAEVFQQFWSTLRPQLRDLREEPLICTLDRERAQLRLIGPHLDLAVSGQPA